eukprot:Platyproteum_vivax@DN4906_c0_g1_i1.p1
MHIGRRVIRLRVKNKQSNLIVQFRNFRSICNFSGVDNEHFPSKNHHEVSFDNTRIAFGHKSNYELTRTAAILALCKVKPLVAHANEIIELSHKVLGYTITDWALKKTFFSQFCGGQFIEQVNETIQRLEQNGVGGIVSYSVEQDISEGSSLSDKYLAAIENNFQNILESITKRTHFKKLSFVAVKPTALCDPHLLKLLSNPLQDARNVFAAAAGVSFVPSSSTSVSYDQLKDAVSRIFDMKTKDAFTIVLSVFENHDQISFSEFLNKLDWVGVIEDSSSSAVSKFWGLYGLRGTKLGELKLLQNYMGQLAVAASQSEGVRLFVDAEQSYMQPAIDKLAFDAACLVNKGTGEARPPVVYNTYQCYTKDANCRLTCDYEMLRDRGVSFGAKLVRGAYSVQERKLAKDGGYADPIYSTIEDTHSCYNKCSQDMLSYIETTKRQGLSAKSDVAVFLGSHNEESIKLAAKWMEEMSICHDDPCVTFGQLQGMGDHITFTLARNHFRSFKYLPYGPIKDTLPYLIRRAQENSSLMGASNKESQLIYHELYERIYNVLVPFRFQHPKGPLSSDSDSSDKVPTSI